MANMITRLRLKSATRQRSTHLMQPLSIPQVRLTLLPMLQVRLTFLSLPQVRLTLNVNNVFEDSQLRSKLAITGSDGMAHMTGASSHFLFGKAVAKAATTANISQYNELPLMHIFNLWHDATKSPLVWSYWHY